jgi:hypothetical protein
MHAVKITDGHDCATQGAIGRNIAHDAKAVHRHQGFDG